MNISLTPRLEKMIRDKVESGLYNNASEVVREALRLLDKQFSATASEKLSAGLVEAKVSFVRGEGREMTDELWDQLMAAGDEMASSGLDLGSDVAT